jgi:hypothetical protein
MHQYADSKGPPVKGARQGAGNESKHRIGGARLGAIDDAVSGVAFIVAAIVLAFEDGEQRAEDRHPARR